jgi:uncharacterized glyoxalase superfamily protein PhnB
MVVRQAVPLVRVEDVSRSLAWYRDTLGFSGDPFPDTAPHEFAILRQGRAEIMIRRGTPNRSQPRSHDWDLYLRVEGDDLRAVFEKMRARGIVTRRLERMAYGLAEFEVSDPDGYILCLSHELEGADDLPAPAV